MILWCCPPPKNTVAVGNGSVKIGLASPFTSSGADELLLCIVPLRLCIADVTRLARLASLGSLGGPGRVQEVVSWIMRAAERGGCNAENEGETLPRLVQTGKSFLLCFRSVHFSWRKWPCTLIMKTYLSKSTRRQLVVALIMYGIAPHDNILDLWQVCRAWPARPSDHRLTDTVRTVRRLILPIAAFKVSSKLSKIGQGED